MGHCKLVNNKVYFITMDILQFITNRQVIHIWREDCRAFGQKQECRAFQYTSPLVFNGHTTRNGFLVVSTITLEMDSRHKNKLINFFRSLYYHIFFNYPLSTILIFACRRSVSCTPRGRLPHPRFASFATSWKRIYWAWHRKRLNIIR